MSELFRVVKVFSRSIKRLAYLTVLQTSVMPRELTPITVESPLRNRKAKTRDELVLYVT